MSPIFDPRVTQIKLYKLKMESKGAHFLSINMIYLNINFHSPLLLVFYTASV